MKKSPDRVACANCGAPLSGQTETCPACTAACLHGESSGDLGSPLVREFRVLQLCGFAALAAGVLAALADSRFAAIVALTIGLSIYLVGLLGAWWNRHK